MKLRLCFALSMLCAVAHAQGSGFNSSQNTGFGAVGIAPSIQQNGLIKYHQLLWTISGTVTTCQVSLDTSPDNSTWTVGGAIAAQTCTSNGSSAITGIVSANYIRVNLSTLTGGGSVTIQYEGWAYNPSGGGGSGTVSANNTAANVPAAYATAGGSTTVGPATVLALPNGTAAAPTLGAINGTSSGWYWDNVNSVWGFSVAGAEKLAMYAGDFSLSNDQGLTWSTTGSNPNVATAVGLVPATSAAVKVLDVGNGTPGNATGYLKTASICQQTGANYTNATTTPSNFCSFALPAFALNWSYHCDLVYQGSVSTATLALSINAQQAPTFEMGSATIYSNNNGAASTFTTGTATGSGAGNLAVLTGAAEAATGTNYNAQIYGTIEASSTAGSFAIQAAAGGVGTLTILRGSYCELY